MNDAFGVSKSMAGDALVSAKTKLVERKKAKPKKVNFALRPIKSMETLLKVAKAACDCKECKEKEIKCSQCPKCSGKNR